MNDTMVSWKLKDDWIDKNLNDLVRDTVFRTPAVTSMFNIISNPTWSFMISWMS